MKPVAITPPSPSSPVLSPGVFEVSENILVYAFRYALGRRTGAVIDVVEELLRHWHRLAPYTQTQIADEITRAIGRRDAGAQCDEDEWRKVLARHDGVCLGSHDS